MSLRTAADDPIRFFLPGPTYVLAAVREALTGQPLGHRSSAFKALYAKVAERLPAVFRTQRPVVVATGSATLLMESAVASTVRARVLNLICGSFSERWHAICRSRGLAADRVAVPWGQAVDPELVRQALRRQRYEAVTVVHNETSTGATSPLAAIAEVVREESDALILVDTVSSLAGLPVETDGWGLDVVLTGSQKALALPPGLAFAAVSERAEARMAAVPNRGYYTDLAMALAKHREGSTVTTPGVSLVFALDRQLDHLLAEGVEARWGRHRRLYERTAAWAAERGFSYASTETARSHTVSCLRPPAGVDPQALVKGLAESGFTVGSGYGAWKPTTFRIGHMGEVTEADLDGLLARCDALLAAAGVAH